MTGAPLRIGLSNGISTWTRRKRAWSNDMALQSTLTTQPIPLPISLPTSSLIRSKGSPYTCTHKGMCEKLTENAVIPFSHCQSNKRWFSKLHGPLFITHTNWLSKENLNWVSPSPTTLIFKSWPNFHILRDFLPPEGWWVLLCWNNQWDWESIPQEFCHDVLIEQWWLHPLPLLD